MICVDIARTEYGVDVALSEVEDYISELIRARNLDQKGERALITPTEAASVVLAHFCTWIEDRSGSTVGQMENVVTRTLEIERLLFSGSS